ncbi:MAG: DNA-3-methyladenine glycosylase family protein [Thermoanaerobaculia bacterium]
MTGARFDVPGVDLDLVARSHGWYDLAPFAWDEARCTLSFVFLSGDTPERVVLSARDGSIRAVSTAPARLARPVVGRVLDLGSDLGPFHALCAQRRDEGYGWIADRRAGRILRAPTLFEDAVKVLCTTNCSWSLTRSMVTRMAAAFDRGGAFPDAAFLAALSERRLRDELKLGYRAPFLRAFAARVAGGALDLAAWEDAALPDEELAARIRSEKGFGPYAAETLLRLLGRHGRLGLDSWSRKKVAELRFGGRAVKDARVERLYAPFGRYAGLAFWLDVTRDWHEGRESLWP